MLLTAYVDVHGQVLQYTKKKLSRSVNKVGRLSDGWGGWGGAGHVYLHSSEVLPHFLRDSCHEGKLWH